MRIMLLRMYGLKVLRERIGCGYIVLLDLTCLIFGYMNILDRDGNLKLDC